MQTKKNVRLVNSVPPTIPFILGDAGRIIQVKFLGAYKTGYIVAASAIDTIPGSKNFDART